MDGTRVHKFGGAALRDGAAVRRAAEIVRAHGGPAPVVVVSAHEGVTRLLAGAAEAARGGRVEAEAVRLVHRSLLRELALLPELVDRLLAELQTVLVHAAAERRLDRRRRDFVLSFGERMSARIVAAHLRARGLPATPVDAFDLGLASETRGGRTLPREAARDAVRAAVRAVPGIPVVTGFLALDDEGHVTTLGRNGSDLTAVWLGAALGAREVHLWKTVDAICSADPRLVPAARPLERLSYEAASELAQHGADVLHPAAMDPARRAGLSVRVRPTADPAAPGTLIGPAAGDDPPALAHRRRVALARFADPSLSAACSEACREAGLEPFLERPSGGGTVLLLPDPGEGAGDPLPPLARGAALERNLATLALVGGGARDEALAPALVEHARRAGLLLRRCPEGDGPLSRLFLAREGELDPALRAVHAALVEGAERAVS